MALFFASVCAAGCGASTDAELLVGKWALERVTEKVTPPSGTTTTNEMEGFEDQTMELGENGRCRRTDRGSTWMGMWYVSTDRHLVFSDTLSMTVVEDYVIGTLDKERLVCGKSYTHLDSVSGEQTRYSYVFAYSKRD